IYASPSEGIFTDLSFDDEGVVTDFNNLETNVCVSPTPMTRIHTIHPKTQVLRDPMSAVQTRSKVNKNSKAYALVSTQANDDQGATLEEIDLNEEHFVLPIWSAYSTPVKSSRDKIKKNTDFKTCEKPVSQVEQVFMDEHEKLKRQKKEANDAAKSLRKEATHDIHNTSTSKAQAKPYRMDLKHQEKVLSMQDVDDEEPANVEEMLEVIKAAKLMTEVVTTARATTTAEATKVSVPRRKRGVVIQDPEETTSTAVIYSKVQSKDKG
nr:hypothetical protein [Tanacetum cinerariifolium]